MKYTNGLQLDFSIERTEDRQEYVNRIIDNFARKGQNLRPNDLELLANYVLYGKKDNGLSVVDEGLVQIETKHSTYSRNPPKSLNALIDDPNFSEDKVIPLNRKKIFKTTKPTINREENAEIAPLHELWESIDWLADRIDYFSGKKQLADFSPETQDRLRKLDPPSRYALYQMRHTLVEMRREQFTIRDSFSPTIQPLISRFHYVSDPYGANTLNYDPDFSNYAVLPLGLFTENNVVFSDYAAEGNYPQFISDHKDFFRNLDLEGRMEDVAGIFREKDRDSIRDKCAINFCNPDHIYTILRFYLELDAGIDDDPETSTAPILSTLNFYSAAAILTPEQREILRLKILKQPNGEISEVLKEKFGKTHTDNYISTIFKKNICGAIAEAAKLHYDTYCNRENLAAFKKCNCCGKRKLKDTRNFVRKARSSDGFSNCCKVCDKENRKKN